jgi:hypothetical protein
MHETDRIHKVWKKYVGLALVLITISLFFKHLQREKMVWINSNYQVEKGRISFLGESALTMQLAPSFEYCVLEECYKSNFSISKVCPQISQEDKQAVRNITFPVLYATDDPSKAIILVQRTDFVRYGIEYPNRSKALLNRIFECKHD